MRVAHVIYRYLPVLGGAEVYVQALREALAAVCDGQTVYQADLGAAGEGVVAVPVARRTGLKLVDFNLALAPLAREILAHDVVVVHNPEHLTRGLAGPRTVLESHAKRADERLELEDLRRATKVIARTLHDLLG